MLDGDTQKRVVVTVRKLIIEDGKLDAKSCAELLCRDFPRRDSLKHKHVGTDFVKPVLVGFGFRWCTNIRSCSALVENNMSLLHEYLPGS